MMVVAILLGIALMKKISNYFAENTEQDGPYGVRTVEILDVNQDGNLDIVVGGAYADADYDYMLMGPTILWGDGSSNYDYDNKTEIWGFGEKTNNARWIKC